VPVDLPVGDHAAFLWMAVATHALVGYTLGKVLLDESAWGLLGGVAADVDLLFPLAWQPPLVHRGITHTALAAVLPRRPGRTLAAVRWPGRRYRLRLAPRHRRDDAGRRGAVLSLSTVRVDLALGGHSGTATVLLWIACLTALYWHRR